MSTRRISIIRIWGLLGLIALLVLTGCGRGTPTRTGTEHVVLALGYIPSVQFAPFYVAQDKGFFAEEGLEVEFRHGFETDFLKLVAAGEIPFVVASGEEVILGRSRGLPVTYVAQWYTRFPVAMFALAEKGFTSPKDIEGKTLGIPGPFGATYIGWKALVYAVGIDEDRVKVESIGFTQAAAVSEGKVDAAMDYIANGPVRLRLAGQEVTLFPVSDYIDLPSNGLVTSDKMIRERPDLVTRMTRAMLRGIRYTLDHPDEAFHMALRHVPEAGGEQEKVSRAVFDASLPLWTPPPGRKLGHSDPEQWERAEQFLREMGLIETHVDVTGVMTNDFVKRAGF
ncbi:MAG: ABC transporter substrate-binding protein [Chloroflexi bacterium]|nr:ABC transporter substrate-binding protein [Chloroflexota bacterium]